MNASVVQNNSINPKMKRALFSIETLWLSLVFILITLESTLRFIITGFYYIFPFPSLLEKLYDSKAFGWLRSIFNRGLRLESHASTFSMSTPELIAHWGYVCEEHIAETEDGFLLVLHRLRKKVEPKEQKSDSGYPILLMHGLMMSDEAFVYSDKNSLPISLLNSNYDVWLCNNRGNKYSWMHKKYNRNDEEYWDWNIDHLAKYDLPACINYVSNHTGYQQVGYIGYSNGTAQMFAALSRADNCVSSKLSLFVAIAPACRITKLNNKNSTVIHPLISSSLNLFQMVFGKKALLKTTDAWKALLAPSLMVNIMDKALKILFDWTCNNTDYDTKCAFYQHIYSTMSVKCVYHWFQMLKSGKFEHFNDTSITEGAIVVPSYDLKNINMPIVLVYGGSDQLTDIGYLKNKLGTNIVKDCEIKHYEHLDFLSSSDCKERVHKVVIEAFSKHIRVNTKYSISTVSNDLSTNASDVLFNVRNNDHILNRKSKKKITHSEPLNVSDLSN